MNKKLLFVLIPLIIIILFLTKVYPKISFYSTNSVFDGGCFTICENKKEISCSDTTCTYMCLGDFSNNCDR